MTGIKCSNLSFKRQSTLIFENLNFDFKAHQLSLLVGESGCGKSTLFKLIAGFADLEYSGQIVFGPEVSQNTKCKIVGFVFQNPNRQFTMRTLRREIVFALENLRYSPAEIARRLNAAVVELEASELLDRQLSQLSGGEKQRAALTVLIAMDANILLLDEPFASVDFKSRQQLIRLLGQLRDNGKTIVVSDHDLIGYQEVADHLIRLEDGRLKEQPLTELNDAQKGYCLTQTLSGQASFLNLAAISIQNNNRLLLDNAFCSFNHGITTLTGDNGSGKSTLLRAIAQRQKYRGKMLFNGKKLKKTSRLYRSLTLVVQDAEKQFIGLTPRDEFDFNQDINDAMQKKQNEAISFLGLSDKLDYSLYHLSEGQKKMVQLISMLSLDLSFLMLDEPFTGLDDRACRYFVDWIQEKAKKQDFLIVSHRLAPLCQASQFHIELTDQKLMVKDGGNDGL
ncbi:MULTISPECIES: ABC transporter ATP-binding protein [unclassified Enterococcus]|uniref:ABC transporter ATP-binding protein n=1 Tax=unclassified Enterococcus TaxID=2608891 RepID=UPI0015582160|nr:MULTISPECIES: ABC transporter ATP-binding protein [unclassified Enterococcus]MBS7578270.1 ABC transporter ATP-binding protein [Enterococcus sp. MMGLQ5-2]MBS7585450.1 ABC transporter ATP-binding protein [Enterococcus sp. MMGLQ5-1]NPD13307.1 ABC transporter ATP-binding protein [Enterococcus sp. MMGLQ5-1]NPD38101.1 ABC transporter ATP-binding protein [Enterococcus sp. MMGLQ5-2]